jgi:hypothetical protein
VLRTTLLLGRDDRREQLAAHVPDHRYRGRVHPANDPVLVEDVARDIDVLERFFDVVAQ